MLLCHNYENVSIHILPEELVSFSYTYYVQILADVHVCIYAMFLYDFIVFIELLLCFMILCQKWRNKTVQSTIKTLNEAFGIEGFTISITWEWILRQRREFNKGSAMAFLVDEWVTPDFGNNSNKLEQKLGGGLLNLPSLWPTLVSRLACLSLSIYSQDVTRSIFAGQGKISISHSLPAKKR